MRLTPVLLDLRGLVMNAYHSSMTPEPLLGEIKDKINTATYGFETFITKFFDPLLAICESPIHMIAVLDDGNTYRKALFPGYKAKRHARVGDPIEAAEITKAMEYANKFLVSLGIPLVKLKGQEADDVIAYLTSKLEGPVTIATCDGDLLQLADKAGIFQNTLHKVEFKANVPINLVALYKSIVGDPTDEYPGVKGVGDKGWESLVEDYGYDGMDQLLDLLSRNERLEIKSIAASGDNKVLKKCAEDYDNWYRMYNLARLHPELCEGANVKLEWKKRLPFREKLVAILEETGTLEWVVKYDKFCYVPVLVTKDNLDHCIQEIADLTEETPAVAWDYETYDIAKNPNYVKAANGKNYVDVLNSAIAGCSFAVGPNFNYVYYFSVAHKDTDNVPKEWVQTLIKHFQEENIDMVAQNVAFEATVTRMQLGYEIKCWEDTKCYAHHIDENDENGLKHLSKKYLNYTQTTYNETLAAAGASDMSEITGEEVLHYGCDDSLATGHLYQFFTILSQLEGTYQFIRENECPAVAALIEPYINGVALNPELMAKLTEQDRITTEVNFAKIRSILEENCTNPNLDAVESLFADQESYIRYKAKTTFTAKNQAYEMDELNNTIKCAVEKYRTDLKENSRYVKPYELRTPVDFLPTANKLSVVAKILELPEITSLKKGDVSDWLDECPDCEFKKLLAPAVDHFSPKKRTGEEYEAFEKYCKDTLWDAAPVSQGGTQLNLGSPKQMQHMLYLLLGLPIRVRTKVQKGSVRHQGGLPGSPATDDAALDFALANDCAGLNGWKADLLKTLAEYTSAATRLSNYWTPYPLWAGPDNIMHPNFLSPGTVTRRPTGSSPNLLQVSKGKVRECFIPRSKDNVIVSIDFSSEELMVMACLTQDENMLSCYTGKVKKDLHALTACGITPLLMRKYDVDPMEIPIVDGKVPYEWFKEHQDDNSPLGKMLKDIRGTSKTVNFGVGYGATGVTVSQQAMIPIEDADLAVSGMLTTYPGINRWKEELYAQARRDGYVATAYGSRRHCGNNLRTGSRGEIGRWERQLSNFAIQGVCADLLKVVLAGVHRERLFQSLNAYLIAPVYDEILAEVPRVNVYEYIHRMSDHMAVKMPGMELEMIPDCSFGNSWGKQIEVGVRPSLEIVNKALEELAV